LHCPRAGNDNEGWMQLIIMHNFIALVSQETLLSTVISPSYFFWVYPGLTKSHSKTQTLYVNMGKKKTIPRLSL
jgi:hypothetical protein